MYLYLQPKLVLISNWNLAPCMDNFLTIMVQLYFLTFLKHVSKTYGNKIVVDMEQGREFLKILKQNEQTYIGVSPFSFLFYL